MLRNTTKWSSCLRNKKARAYPNKDALLTFYKHSGQWLWFGWKSICFPQQRSLVRIQSPAKFYIELYQTLNCWAKTKLKRKRVRNSPLMKKMSLINTLKTFYVYVSLHLVHICLILYFKQSWYLSLNLYGDRTLDRTVEKSHSAIQPYYYICIALLQLRGQTPKSKNNGTYIRAHAPNSIRENCT